MILFGKNNITLRTVIKVFGIQLFVEHDPKLRFVEDYSTRLIVQPIDLVSCVAGVAPFTSAPRASFK